LRDWQKAATCSLSEEEANLLGRIRWPLFVERIRTAKALQDMGFTLDEVINAPHAHDAGGATCESERWRLEAVVDRIATKITELERARQNAVDILQDCRAGRCRLTPSRQAPPQDNRH
jgi:DNA-binding transcriptional MerR regulator